MRIYSGNSLQDNSVLNNCPTEKGVQAETYLRTLRYLPLYLTFLSLFFMGFVSTASAELLFKSDFETGAIQGSSSNPDGWGKQLYDNPSEVQSTIKRAGKYAFKTVFKKSGNYGTAKPRSELLKLKGSGGPLLLDTEYWIGLSTFLPSDWVDDYTDNPDMIWQFHGAGTFSTGKSAPLLFRVVGDKWRIESKRDIDGKWENSIPWTGSVEKGVWVDWVINVNFTGKTNGFIKIWKNGKIIVDYKGPTGYNYDGSGSTYLKIGDYKWAWLSKPSRVTTRTLYHDEVRIAGPGSRYEDVAPGGNSNSTAPTNQSPEVDAGPDQTTTLHSPAIIQLSGIATDDGLPNGSLTTNWSKVSGPDEVDFADASVPDTTATFYTEGSYVLRLAANDGERSTSDEMTVVVNSSSSDASTEADAVIRINAGGGAYVDSLGRTWAADQGASGGKTYKTTKAIGNTQDDALYQTERYGDPFSYSFPVSDGVYQVNLHLAEIYFNSANRRKFDVFIEGRRVEENLDIWSETGAFNALTRSYEVTVGDGVLNIELDANVNNGKVSAIEISSVQGSDSEVLSIQESDSSNGSVASDQCVTSTGTWTNAPLEVQSGKFMVDFDAIPESNGINAITALSAGTGTVAEDFAVKVRFNDQGRIDAGDGTTYRADNNISYSAGKQYHFRLEVNVPADSYSVYVTPAGGKEQALAMGYAFSSDEAGVNGLDNWALWAGTGSHQVCNFLGAYPNREISGLVALYGFEEGQGNIVNDISGVGSPLNLTIDDDWATSWVPGGLVVESPTLIASEGPATKLIDAIRATDEITIEAWIVPDNTGQNGPARILTLSTDMWNRNFTLGQAGVEYEVRLRTTATGNNGMKPSLPTSSWAVNPDLTHVVYTRDKSGVAILYVNGEIEASGTISGDLSNWDTKYRFALANELTKDRAWLGEYQMVSIYGRALNADEVKQNFAVGPTDGVK